MNDSTRIEQLTSVETVPRQTQKRDFGAVVANSIGSVLAQGTALVRGAMGAVPMLSAAVSGLQSVNSFASAATAGTTTPGVTHASASTPLATLGIGLGGSSGGGLPSLQSTMQNLQTGAEMTNVDYLVLQNAMQQESQQYTTLTNILKVRSDSAKAAINNIR